MRPQPSFTVPVRLLLGLALFATSGACTEDPEPRSQQGAVSCAIGQTQACLCPNGSARLAQCAPTGDAYLECPCEGAAGVGGEAGTFAGMGGTSGMLGGQGAIGGMAGMTSGGTGGMAGMTSGGTGGMAGMTSGGTGGMAGMTSGGAGGMAGMTTGGTGGGTGMETGGMGGASDDPLEAVRQACVDEINMYRATLSLAPLRRATPQQETCSDGGAKLDADNNAPHSSAGMCQLGAQNSCPGYPVGGFGGSATLTDALKRCLSQMWAEGEPPIPRDQCIRQYQTCFLPHGHYINMSDTRSTVVACGFYQMANGRWWMNQNFGR